MKKLINWPTHLQQCGIGNESLVGLYFERSVEMVVSIMGIWKA